MIRIQRALLSVHDKAGLLDLARGLRDVGAELVSTGGTASALRDAGFPVRVVSDVTRFPEIFGGRVKTLHPLIHGGILLRRDDDEHRRQAAEAGIGPIDLVAVNLYPFERTVAAEQVARAEAIEEIDVGGPAMLRAAAKNHRHVVVLTEPRDYVPVLRELAKNGGVAETTAERLAVKAFARTSAYDAAIAGWLGREIDIEDAGAAVTLSGLPHSLPRYGENPHQAASAYVVAGERGGVLQARTLQGKALSYNNIVDLDAAWTLARDLYSPGVALIKHANPCGAAEGGSLLASLQAARACDPQSAFGAILALNSPVDESVARAVLDQFVECVIAPSFTPEAIDAFALKKDVRVLQGELPPRPRCGRDWRRIAGGFLLQDWDDALFDGSSVRVVTRRAPSALELEALAFAWRVVRHVRSNAILFAGPGRTLGVGAGQTSRIDAVEVAVRKAEKHGLDLRGSVVASDAFFPFRDGLEAAAAAGATAVIQPGGSRRDDEVIAAADERGMAMVVTGVRHFRH